MGNLHGGRELIATGRPALYNAQELDGWELSLRRGCDATRGLLTLLPLHVEHSPQRVLAEIAGGRVKAPLGARARSKAGTSRPSNFAGVAAQFAQYTCGTKRWLDFFGRL
jgi:hypothetical protein